MATAIAAFLLISTLLGIAFFFLQKAVGVVTGDPCPHSDRDTLVYDEYRDVSYCVVLTRVEEGACPASYKVIRDRQGNERCHDVAWYGLPEGHTVVR